MKEMKTLNGYEIVDEKARSMYEELAPKADALYIAKSTNLLNLNAVEHGKYLWNGKLTDNANYTTTDFIPCQPGDTIRHQFDYLGVRYDNEVQPTYNSMAVVCAYDADKNYIQGSMAQPKVYVYTAPEGAYYVRITYKTSDWNTAALTNNSAIIISDSSEAVPFDDYQAPTMVLKEEALPNLTWENLKVNYPAYGLPILYLTGDTEGMDKDNAVTLDYVYGDMSGTATVKWQGSSSLAYDKKNYTVKFDHAFEAFAGFGLNDDWLPKQNGEESKSWGEQKKYCLKANYIDFSHCRNVVSARLWGQIAASRSGIAQTVLPDCPNYGAVDGFPVVLMINGEFMGVYTFNIPKDGWMLNMGAGAQECILCADAHSDSNRFKAEATLEGDFDIEYITNEDDTAWARTSLNNLINACIASDGTDLDTTIATMLDWDSAIDYYIFVALLRGEDMVTKNYLLFTHDGTKWRFGAYDIDATYGLAWDGKSFIPARGGCSMQSLAASHKVFELIKTYKTNALKTRYQELRNSVMSEDNVALMFRNFAGLIPRNLLDDDNRKWPAIPNTNTNNVQQILDWYRLRCVYMDNHVAQL